MNRKLTAMQKNITRSQRQEASRDRERGEGERGDGNAQARAHPEVGHAERDPDELGDDGQEVENEQVPDAEPAPEAAESFSDEPGVSDAGHCAEADDHLLGDDQHRDEQQQDPEHAVPVVLTRLRVRRDATGVVIGDHHNETRTRNGREGDQSVLPRPSGRPVVHGDSAHRAGDVTDVLSVEHRGCEVELSRAVDLAGAHRGPP
jgi:hypothetical protein